MHPAASHYVKHRMSTATPAQLIGLLYDGLVASLRKAADAQVHGQRAAAGEALTKAQRIVTELRCSLNFDAGELAGNLDAIYEFTWRQLVQANVAHDPLLTGKILELVVPLRDAWAAVIAGEVGLAARKTA